MPDKYRYCQSRYRRMRCRRALTLVETLIALTLAATISALTTMVAVQVTRSQRMVDKKLADFRKIIRLERLVRQDVRGMIAQKWKSMPGIESQGLASRELVRVHTLVHLAEGDSVSYARLPAVVAYALTPDGDGAHRLIRTVHAEPELTDNGNAETLMTGVRDARVEQFSGGTWQPVNKHEGIDDAQGLRLVCEPIAKDKSTITVTGLIRNERRQRR